MALAKRSIFLKSRGRIPACIRQSRHAATLPLEQVAWLSSEESPMSSSIYSGSSDGWLLNTIVLLNSFLAGLSTARAPVGVLHPQRNSLMPLSPGLVIQIHGSERRGKRAKDWPAHSASSNGNAPKLPTQNIVAKKRAGQKVVDSGCLFANIFLPTFFMQSVSMALDRRRVY
jgi:hypothetical protein